VEFIDFYPTLADLCGLEPPDDLDGVGLRPVLDAPAARVKDAAFTQVEWAHSDDPRSVQGGSSDKDDRIFGSTIRTDCYRYIHWKGDGGGEELYDHVSDPGEFTNLAGSPEHAEILQRLRTRLDAGLPG
jgi:arylsulfatase A-like enzyme